MSVRTIHLDDHDAYIELHRALFPHKTSADIDPEFYDVVNHGTMHGQTGTILVAVEEDSDRRLIGFIEVALHAFARGCTTKPIGFVEGWYVDAAYRKQGIGRALFGAAERWALGHGCAEMASGCDAENQVSLAAHLALGYEVVYRDIHFRRAIAG